MTLGLEVNSMHLLAVVAGNSVYAFALMLATFLAGLGLGSQAGERLMAGVNALGLASAMMTGYPVHPVLTLAVPPEEKVLAMSVVLQELARRGVLWHPAQDFRRPGPRPRAR